MEGLVVTIGNYKFFVHQSIVTWLILCILITITLIYAGSKIKKADPSKAPTGIVLVFEILVKTAVGVIGGNLKELTWKHVPLFGTLMLAIVLSNLMGLLGLQVPTSNLSVTTTLGMLMVVLIHATDIKLHGIGGKIKGMFEPMPFLFPLNIAGDLAFPLSITLRLFGNMLGGSIITGLLYVLIKALLPYSIISFIVTPFLHLYFDVFSAFMQTYIFFTIASFFLSQSSDV
ncbi:MAG: F0F1 ATP synthase subunit A [Erysipelotrichaceae bacterium]|nr:F0F1 ATP synthase subunit A [Erysipelotrichaceae bacterium]